MALRSVRLAALMSMALFLIACGNGADTGTTRPQAPVAQPESPQPVEQDPAEQAEAQPPTVAQQQLAAVEESAATEADAAADAEQNIVLEKSAPAAEPPAAAEWQFKQGAHFNILTTSQGTSSPPDMIEVAEVFWYGCPHCFNFNPVLESWEKKLPDDVNFVLIPVMWNPTNQVHARIFYTAEALGKLDEMHDEIFKEIHVRERSMTNQEEIEEFFTRFGVSRDMFRQTFRSFAVESKLKRARNLTLRYRVNSVPLLIINGKYTVDGPMIRNFDQTLAVADELIERERQRH